MRRATERITIERLTPPRELREQLAEDVRVGLAGTPKRIPSKYFYDARGSQLFERITTLPEYYLTRTETAILEHRADEIMSVARPVELLELGSGSSPKTRFLLAAMHEQAGGRLYVPFDVSEDALRRAAEELAAAFPWLEIHGYRGDLDTDLPRVPREGRRVIAFLGSTIGNFRREEARAFYEEIAGMLANGDRLLVGYDLVKDPAVLTAAYNDAQGVTAAFNRNVLHVVNRELDADFPADEFEHVAIYRADVERIESGLRAPRALVAHVGALGRSFSLEAGEMIWTEISRKFTREGVERAASPCGLALERWDTDPGERFALATFKAGSGGG